MIQYSVFFSKYWNKGKNTNNAGPTQYPADKQRSKKQTHIKKQERTLFQSCVASVPGWIMLNLQLDHICGKYYLNLMVYNKWTKYVDI